MRASYICTVIAITMGIVRGHTSYLRRFGSVGRASDSPASGAMFFQCNGNIDKCREITPVGRVEAVFQVNATVIPVK
jgi:hypothetical protein